MERCSFPILLCPYTQARKNQQNGTRKREVVHVRNRQNRNIQPSGLFWGILGIVVGILLIIIIGLINNRHSINGRSATPDSSGAVSVDQSIQPVSPEDAASFLSVELSNYPALYQVHYNDHALYIQLLYDGMLHTARKTASGDSTSQETWEDAIYTASEVYRTATSYLPDNYTCDCTVYVHILNDRNQKQILYSLKNGVESYNCVDTAVDLNTTSVDENGGETPVDGAETTTIWYPWYPAGTYEIESDLDSGIYYLKATGSGSAYFEIKDSGSTGDILINDNFKTCCYVSVLSGESLTIKRCQATEVKNAPMPKANKDGSYNAGMYKIGRDIEAGKYKLTKTDDADHAFYEINAKPTGTQNMTVSHSDFDHTTYVTVENGQYLTVNGATLLRFG